ncbi:MAG: hypothetical protein HWE07_16290 [Cytophagia bacterium]|nr:hypothetical protein [Cytophagia bacterium]
MKTIGTPLSKEELLKIKGGGPLDDCIDDCHDIYVSCAQMAGPADPEGVFACFAMETSCINRCYRD